MPRKLSWTERDDQTLRLMRRRGQGWEVIAATLGVSRNATMERARTLHALIERVREEGERAEDPDRRPLPPGHAVSWGVLVRGTSLEGLAYERPGAVGRGRPAVVGEVG